MIYYQNAINKYFDGVKPCVTHTSISEKEGKLIIRSQVKKDDVMRECVDVEIWSIPSESGLDISLQLDDSIEKSNMNFEEKMNSYKKLVGAKSFLAKMAIFSIDFAYFLFNTRNRDKEKINSHIVINLKSKRQEVPSLLFMYAVFVGTLHLLKYEILLVNNNFTYFYKRNNKEDEKLNLFIVNHQFKPRFIELDFSEIEEEKRNNIDHLKWII